MEKKDSSKSIMIGAAFLMATSAIGPGFLTQTAVFTEKFKENFAFAIFISIIFTLVAQLNIWRVMGVTGLRGQDLANRVIPGLGYILAFLVSLGGLAFNIGNVGGAALGLNVVFGLDLTIGIVISGAIGALIFLSKDMGKLLDNFTKVLGGIIILVIAYVTVTSNPPLREVMVKMFVPDDYITLGLPTLTLLGGTIGGYIIFAGGHRLVDAGLTGQENLSKINQSAHMGVFIASLVRVLLFLAVLGVVSQGYKLDPSNPPASAFQYGAGEIGYKIFGVVILAAALTSIVGAAYTSVSFLKTLFPIIQKHEKTFIIGFILTSTLIMLFLGRPVALLVLAGTLNGLILPLTLGVILIAANKKDIVGDYKHSKILTALGAFIVISMGYVGITTLKGMANLFK